MIIFICYKDGFIWDIVTKESEAIAYLSDGKIDNYRTFKEI